jgi:hypothetical protein
VGEGLATPVPKATATATPGQAVVIYDGEVTLGGGWIECKLLEVIHHKNYRLYKNIS